MLCMLVWVIHFSWVVIELMYVYIGLTAVMDIVWQCTQLRLVMKYMLPPSTTSNSVYIVEMICSSKCVVYNIYIYEHKVVPGC